MFSDFLIFALVGFGAQIVDGALGMAYGVVSSTVLLSFGVAPATASASVHAAKLFTTAASGGAHVWLRNVRWGLFLRLAPAGMAGGIAGTYLVTAIDGATIRPFVFFYLGMMGIVIVYKTLRAHPPADTNPRLPVPLGLVGGFVDAVGGGGWGPVVTGTLIGTGGHPRYIVGTVNTAEFFVSVAVASAFVTAVITGHWIEAGGVMDNFARIAGLIGGGLIAAPFAAMIARHVPARGLAFAVGLLVIGLATYQLAKLFG